MPPPDTYYVEGRGYAIASARPNLRDRTTSYVQEGEPLPRDFHFATRNEISQIEAARGRDLATYERQRESDNEARRVAQQKAKDQAYQDKVNKLFPRDNTVYVSEESMKDIRSGIAQGEKPIVMKEGQTTTVVMQPKGYTPPMIDPYTKTYMQPETEALLHRQVASKQAERERAQFEYRLINDRVQMGTPRALDILEKVTPPKQPKPYVAPAMSPAEFQMSDSQYKRLQGGTIPTGYIWEKPEKVLFAKPVFMTTPEEVPTLLKREGKPTSMGGTLPQYVTTPEGLMYRYTGGSYSTPKSKWGKVKSVFLLEGQQQMPSDMSTYKLIEGQSALQQQTINKAQQSAAFELYMSGMLGSDSSRYIKTLDSVKSGSMRMEIRPTQEKAIKIMGTTTATKKQQEMYGYSQLPTMTVEGKPFIIRTSEPEKEFKFAQETRRVEHLFAQRKMARSTEELKAIDEGILKIPTVTKGEREGELLFSPQTTKQMLKVSPTTSFVTPTDIPAFATTPDLSVLSLPRQAYLKYQSSDAKIQVDKYVANTKESVAGFQRAQKESRLIEGAVFVGGMYAGGAIAGGIATGIGKTAKGAKVAQYIADSPKLAKGLKYGFYGVAGLTTGYNVGSGYFQTKSAGGTTTQALEEAGYQGVKSVAGFWAFGSGFGATYKPPKIQPQINYELDYRSQSTIMGREQPSIWTDEYVNIKAKAYGRTYAGKGDMSGLATPDNYYSDKNLIQYIQTGSGKLNIARTDTWFNPKELNFRVNTEQFILGKQTGQFRALGGSKFSPIGTGGRPSLSITTTYGKSLAQRNLPFDSPIKIEGYIDPRSVVYSTKEFGILKGNIMQTGQSSGYAEELLRTQQTWVRSGSTPKGSDISVFRKSPREIQLWSGDIYGGKGSPAYLSSLREAQPEKYAKLSFRLKPEPKIPKSSKVWDNEFMKIQEQISKQPTGRSIPSSTQTFGRSIPSSGGQRQILLTKTQLRSIEGISGQSMAQSVSLKAQTEISKMVMQDVAKDTSRVASAGAVSFASLMPTLTRPRQQRQQSSQISLLQSMPTITSQRQIQSSSMFSVSRQQTITSQIYSTRELQTTVPALTRTDQRLGMASLQSQKNIFQQTSMQTTIPALDTRQMQTTIPAIAQQESQAYAPLLTTTSQITKQEKAPFFPLFSFVPPPPPPSWITPPDGGGGFFSPSRTPGRRSGMKTDYAASLRAMVEGIYAPKGFKPSEYIGSGLLPRPLVRGNSPRRKKKKKKEVNSHGFRR